MVRRAVRPGSSSTRSTSDFLATAIPRTVWVALTPGVPEDSEHQRPSLATVPYVNGGIFEPHEMETRPTTLTFLDRSIRDALFDFFDGWRWHLDENASRARLNEINPDILGFIFEQYINYTESGQKEKGAYYTKPDVTGYMAASVTSLARPGGSVRRRWYGRPLCILLPGSGDAYIHDSILHGVDRASAGSPRGTADQRAYQTSVSLAWGALV